MCVCDTPMPMPLYYCRLYHHLWRIDSKKQEILLSLTASPVTQRAAEKGQVAKRSLSSSRNVGKVDSHVSGNPFPRNTKYPYYPLFVLDPSLGWLGGRDCVFCVFLLCYIDLYCKHQSASSPSAGWDFPCPPCLSSRPCANHSSNIMPALPRSSKQNPTKPHLSMTEATSSSKKHILFQANRLSSDRSAKFSQVSSVEACPALKSPDPISR